MTGGVRLSLVVALCAAALVLAACGGAQVPDRPSATPVATATRSPATTAGDDTSAGGCPNGSLERCYSYGQMSSFLDQARGLVAPFFAAEYRDLPQPSRVVFVPNSRAGRSACGNVVDATAYEYCGANDSIYIGQDLLWAFYSQLGDAAPVVALAHEWGHHVQAYMRVPPPWTASLSVSYEDQADCIAGAWTQYAGRQGILEYPDDLDDVGALLQAIGSRESASRDHGTAAERRRSFDLGYNGGLRSCNAFFANNPVYQPAV